MNYEIIPAKEYVKYIGLSENDQVVCFRDQKLDKTYVGHNVFVNVGHNVFVKDLEYSREDDAFCCPKHRVMLIKGERVGTP